MSETLTKIRVLLHELKDEVGEKARLGLECDVSAELRKLLNLLRKLDLEMIDNSADASFRQLLPEYEKAMEVYGELLVETQNDTVEFEFSPKLQDAPLKKQKSVRFKENLIDPSENRVDFAENVNPAENPFRSYSDDDPQMSSQELFQLNQQQLDYQDEDLSMLSRTIGNTRTIGTTISSELSDHVGLLNDLEGYIYDSGNRLDRAKRRLSHYNEKLKENGSLVTIFVLTFVLFLLLVLLK